ncbi:MAG: hypothetical protein ACP5XB_29305 [Isosphaeraceae bacterium]
MSGKRIDAVEDADAQAGNPPPSVDWETMGLLDGSSLTELLRACIGSVLQGAAPRKTWGQLLVETLLTKAAGGDMRALLEIWARLEGKPGSAKVRPRPPLQVPDELARMILNYGRETSDCHRDV